MAGVFRESALEEEAKALVAVAGRPVFGGRDHLALAEAPGSPWFDALGNALALEALSHPLLAEGHAPLRAGIAAFLPALEEQGALRRRAGPARIRITSDDVRRFHIETPSHVFTGDLWHGVLRQALRATPGHTVALHTGNTIVFRLGRRMRRVDVEDTITSCGIERVPGGVRLFHESRIAMRALVRTRVVGRLRYAYDIRADTPLLTLTVTFRASDGAAPERLALTTALEAPGDVPYDRIAGPVDDGPAAAQECAMRTVRLVQTPAGPGAHSIDIRPRDPSRLHAVSTDARADGRLHALVLRHEGGTTIAEDRLALAGHPRPDLDAIFARRTREGGRDVSLCPAPGLAAQAIAAHLLWRDRAGETPDDALDATLARLRPTLAHSEHAAELAGLVLAEEACARRGMASTHAGALDTLLEEERRGRVATPDAQAMTLLALARATTLTGSDPRIAPAIARGIAALAGDAPADDLARTFLPRALRAVQAARVAGALVLDETAAAGAARLLRREEAWLRDRTPRPDDTIALRAALLTARLAPDALMMRAVPAKAAA